MSPDTRTAAPPAWGWTVAPVPSQHIARFTARRDDTKAAYQNAMERAAEHVARHEDIPESLQSECRRRREEWQAAERDLIVLARRADGARGMGAR